VVKFCQNGNEKLKTQKGFNCQKEEFKKELVRFLFLVFNV
jgi:hypothetical protein